MSDSIQGVASAGQSYLLLADISGYTWFMSGVEDAHGVDFSDGIPFGYGLLDEVLDAVVRGVEPDFEVAKLEGDAVFAVAPADALDRWSSTAVRWCARRLGRGASCSAQP